MPSTLAARREPSGSTRRYFAAIHRTACAVPLTKTTRRSTKQMTLGVSSTATPTDFNRFIAHDNASAEGTLVSWQKSQIPIDETIS
jgi:hypothetical protein